MTNRILDFSDQPAFLRARNEQLVIERKDCADQTVPITDVSVLVLAHPQVVCTHAVLSLLMDNGATVIVADKNKLPSGLMLPTWNHFAQTERFTAQAEAKAPTKKRIWQTIVKRKILFQADLLNSLYGNDHGLKEMAKSVRSGDPSNVEAQAARRYWPALFNDDQFRRRRDADDQNRFLNYGYAVLRALVARAICAAGLHPSLGVHHHNRYDSFCLADDLMEPYRTFVDAAVVNIASCFGPHVPLDKTTKPELLAAFTSRYTTDNEVRTLFDLITRTASSLAKVISKETKTLYFPGDWKVAEEH